MEFLLKSHFSFYYNKHYHQIKFYLKKNYGQCGCHCTTYKQECKIYYNIPGFNKVLYDEYYEDFSCIGRKINNFKFIQEIIPISAGIMVSYVTLLKIIKNGNREEMNTKNIKLEENYDIQLLEKEFKKWLIC